MTSDIPQTGVAKKSRKKMFLIIGGVVVVVSLGVISLLQDTKKGEDVFAEAAKSRELIEKVSASGRVQPKTKVDITSEINGEMVWIGVKEGDRVEVGDLLVVLDTVQLRSDVDQARFALNEANARLAGSKTNLEQASDEYEREKKLDEAHHSSEAKINNARFAYENAQSNYDASQAQAHQAKSRYDKQLDYLRKAMISAPMEGVITYLDCEVGEIAAAQTGFSQGRILMTIANLDIFEVEVEVDETEIAKVRLGQSTEIEVDAFPDTVFAGSIVEIGNTAIFVGAGTQDQSTNFRVKVVFNDRNADIRPGMSATVDITANARENALSIPFSAVVMRTYDMDSLETARAGGQTGDDDGGVQAAESASDTTKELESDDEKEEELKGVFVIRDGVARFVQVQTGIADQKHIEIISGLEEQDSVISGPYRVLRSIKDGDAVKTMKLDDENKSN